MTSQGILGYDLAGNWCEECGRPKVTRAFALGLTGCPACDDAITRHRCTELPPADTAAEGTRWQCRDCRSVWTAREEPGSCGECGQPVTEHRWDLTEDRQGSGPRRDPVGFTPFRNLLRPLVDTQAEEERDRREWIAGVVERLGLVLKDGA